MSKGIELFRLFGSVLVDNDKANESISKTESKAEMLGKTLSNGVKTAGKWALGIAGGVTAAGTALFAMANETAMAADAIDKLSERTGINREELQRWKYAAGQSGADIGKLEVGMKTLSDQMDAASQGSEKNISTFEKLGISIEDLKTKSQQDIFGSVMQALADMPQGAERNALGNDVLGKSYTELLPLLNAGSAGMSDLMKRADELGIVMSEEAVKANVVFGDSLADVKQSTGAIVAQLTTSVLPIMQLILTWVLAHIPEIKDVIGIAFGLIAKVVETAWNWMENYLIPAFDKLYNWTKENWPVISKYIQDAIDTVMPLFTALWSFISNYILPIFGALFDWVGRNFPMISKIVGEAFGFVIDIATGVIETITDVIDSIKSAIGWFQQLFGWSGKKVTVDTSPTDYPNPRAPVASGTPTGRSDSSGVPAGGSSGNTIVQNITVNSPTPLSPAETARQVKNASREMALEV